MLTQLYNSFLASSSLGLPSDAMYPQHCHRHEITHRSGMYVHVTFRHVRVPAAVQIDESMKRYRGLLMFPMYFNCIPHESAAFKAQFIII
jgi:hypothetical protein